MVSHCEVHASFLSQSLMKTRRLLLDRCEQNLTWWEKGLAIQRNYMANASGNSVLPV